MTSYQNKIRKFDYSYFILIHMINIKYKITHIWTVFYLLVYQFVIPDIFAVPLKKLSSFFLIFSIYMASGSISQFFRLRNTFFYLTMANMPFVVPWIVKVQVCGFESISKSNQFSSKHGIRFFQSNCTQLFFFQKW